MLRLGIVDFDSSHSAEFTRRLNHVHPDTDQHVDGARVVLGCPGSSEMAPERIPGFTRDVVECGVKLVERPEQMIGQIDAVMILSLSGRRHRQRVQPFLEAGIPAYVDKPFACSLADAEAMVELSRHHQTVLFSSSAMRFADELTSFAASAPRYGTLHSAISYGPAKRSESDPGLFHYGIHATEMLFTLMGPGCRSVSTVSNEDGETCTAVWNDGRVATLRGNRAGATAYGFVAFCEHAVVSQSVSTRQGYRNLCRAIVETFNSGRAAVPGEQTLEIVKFILASLESERRGGTSIELENMKR